MRRAIVELQFILIHILVCNGLIFQYDCAAFLQQHAKLKHSTPIKKAAGTVKWQWDYLLTEPFVARLKLASAEFQGCKNILEIGAHPGRNIGHYVSTADTVTIVSPLFDTTCEYVGGTLIRQVRALLEDFSDNIVFDCVLDVGIDCYSKAYRDAVLHYSSQADIVFLGGAVGHPPSDKCAEALVSNLTSSMHAIKYDATLDLSRTPGITERFNHRHLWVLTRPNLRTCRVTHTQYEPSQLELTWFDLVEKGLSFDTTAPSDTDKLPLFERAYKNDFCDHVLRYRHEFETMLHGVAVPAHLAPELFSKFVYTVDCDGHKVTQLNTYIEPVTGIVRHPFSWCDKSKAYPVMYDYLLVGTDSMPGARHAKFLFDFGARQWDVGVGLDANGTRLAAQNFLLDTYHRQGITFDRVFLWDADKRYVNAALAVPERYLFSYTYFNTPIEKNPLSRWNPWRFIKTVAKPYDLVVVKLDIDAPELEASLIEQLLSDNHAMTLIDEFYYEYQPFEAPGHASLAAMYKLMRTLRDKGVRAHGWI